MTIETYHQALHRLLLDAHKAMNGDSNDAEYDALVALVDFLEEEHPEAAVKLKQCFTCDTIYENDGDIRECEVCHEPVCGDCREEHKKDHDANPKERVTLTEHDFTCICGNNSAGHGAYYCDMQGNELDGPPSDDDPGYWCCDKCGRIWDAHTGEVVARRSAGFKMA